MRSDLPEDIVMTPSEQQHNSQVYILYQEIPDQTAVIRARSVRFPSNGKHFVWDSGQSVPA
jgi:hypothetical protein